MHSRSCCAAHSVPKQSHVQGLQVVTVEAIRKQKVGVGITMSYEVNNLQESLTDDMVALAAGLRKNAEAMKQAVARREGLLNDTEDAVEDSLVKAKRSTKESKSLKVKYVVVLCTPSCCMPLGAVIFPQHHQSRDPIHHIDRQILNFQGDCNYHISHTGKLTEALHFLR